MAHTESQCPTGRHRRHTCRIIGHLGLTKARQERIFERISRAYKNFTMAAPSESPFTIGPLGDAMPLYCPRTRLPLYFENGKLVTRPSDGSAPQIWGYSNGFPDLIEGQRFEDAIDSKCRCYEACSNEYSTEHYWIPLMRQLFKDRDPNLPPPRLLSVGCGIGVEVDLLCQAGFACYGVDNGNRTLDWPARQHTKGLMLANAMHLPFADASFDVVFCGCVFPHVGVVGDSRTPAPTCEADRAKLAADMIRVLKPGGYTVACSPNRFFPFDLFHDRVHGTYIPPYNSPFSRFLMSIGDYRSMFTKAGCQWVKSLPVEGFWGFVTMRKSLKGRLLSTPIRISFKLASLSWLKFLRYSPFVPWIAVIGRK